MKNVFFIIAILFLSACTRTVEISTTSGIEKKSFGLFELKNTIRINLDRKDLNQTVTRSVSCSYTGLCMECGLDFHMEMSCGPKLRPFCSGTQEVKSKKFINTYKLQYKTNTKTYESPTYQEEDFEDLEILSSCG